MTDLQLEKVRNSKMAEIALSYFGEVVEYKKRQILNELMLDHREAKHDHPKVLSRIAAYTALNDLVDELKRQIKVGRSTQGGIIEHGTSTS